MSKVVFITGCSKGFGLELAKAALAAGLRVSTLLCTRTDTSQAMSVATGRSLQSLESLQAMGCATLELDVTSSPDVINRVAAEAIAQYGQVDYLINNAGYLLGGSIEENSVEDIANEFQTLVFGPINIIRAFLPHMRARKQGTIVNMSSLGPTLNLPGAGVYCAAKSALDSQAPALFPAGADVQRLQRDIDKRVGAIRHLLLLCPAVFNTAIASADSVKQPAVVINGYTDSQEWVKSFVAGFGTEPGDVVKASKRIIDVMTLQVCDKLPTRLPLGKEAVSLIPDCYTKRIAEVHAWAEIGSGVHRDQLVDWKSNIGQDDKHMRLSK